VVRLSPSHRALAKNENNQTAKREIFKIYSHAKNLPWEPNADFSS